FRQAILYAIPRTQITSTMRLGISEPLPNYFDAAPYLQGAQLTDYSYNVDKAKSLLTEMGYKGGDELVMNYGNFDNGPEQPAIQQALAAVGINLKLVGTDTGGTVALVTQADGWDLRYEYDGQGPEPDNLIKGLLQCPG